MHYRHLFSLLRRIAGAGLGAALLTCSAATLAEDTAARTGDSFPLISLLMPGLLPAAPSEPVADTSDMVLLTSYELSAAPLPRSSIDLTASTDNLWDRLRNGFAMPNLNDDLTLHYQQWYQNRPDALRRMAERSRPYLHFIIQELEARGMPTELALLPMVESSFNPMAYSRSHAAGLWQFIPATGKRFNLEQNWWQDQRRDIVASTGAALDYLQTIYDMHGDWHLALASYNWGENAVKRAIEKNSGRGLPTDYASLSMPSETRHYVPKLQALKNIFGNPVLMVQLGLPEILNRPYFATIDTEKPMDVKTAARLANMPVEDFLALNPAHNRPVIQADTTVVLPADKLDTFRSNLEKHAAPLTAWQTYTLKNGEKLDRVAPRFGIALPELMRVNGLPVRARLRAGSTLLVPAGDGANDLDHRQLAFAPTQIIEAEPVRTSRQRQSATGGKTAKLVKFELKSKARASTQLGARNAKPAARPLARAGAAPRSGKASASAKAAAPGKVARSGSGRRI